MANLLDLKVKINSTKNTGQITKALEMVSAARQRKAQDFLNNSRFLRSGVRELITTVANQMQLDSKSEFDSARQLELPKFFRKQKTGKILIISVMSRKGLCGSLNSSLFFEILNLKKISSKHVDFVSVNKLAQKYLRNFKENIIAFFGEIPENPDIEQIAPLIEYIKENFNNYEEIHIAYSDFVKSGVFKPRLIKLLPIDQIPASVLSVETSEEKPYLEFSIEPDPITVLDSLSNLYIDLEIYESILSSQASEHSSRMIAMKKATDNVKTMVNTLTLKLNKERQAKITQQMAEISAEI
jgi:F-type H+-transporting ATPase subunit gamma